MPIDRLILAAALALAPLAAPLPAHAQDAGPRAFITKGQGTFGTTRMAYVAAEEEFILRSPDGKAAASVFATSYLKAGGKTAKPDASRPVLFVFNGGPGSASLWLHMGMLGPQRIDFDDPDHPQTTAPFHTVANADSPLDVADLVLIDPPGTGYSRILADGTPAMFYGVEQDAVATVQVMEQWLARHGRMNAPKYILSESYGTVRAAVVARLLAGGPTQTGQMDGISLNGVILLGQAMDMAHGAAGDDRGYLGILPSLAATACHFHKVAPGCTPQGQVDAAQAFVDDTYLGALHAGSRLDPARRAAVAQAMARLVGLPAETILANDLRLSGAAFARLLLAAEGRRTGLYDARFTLPLAAAGPDPVADDPAMAQYVPGFVAAWDAYARDTLKIDLPQPYKAIAFRDVNGAWDYGPSPSNYATDLATAMNRNPALRVLVGTGLYDLVTPLGTAGDTMAHSGAPADRVAFRTYPAGHMAYLGREARQALAADLRAFITGSLR